MFRHNANDPVIQPMHRFEKDDVYERRTVSRSKLTSRINKLLSCRCNRL